MPRRGFSVYPRRDPSSLSRTVRMLRPATRAARISAPADGLSVQAAPPAPVTASGRPESFTRSVSTLVLGTGIAQLIPFLVSPALTRLYDPHAFGVFALYASFSAIGGIAATGRYEMAILLPRRTREARTLALIALGTTAVVTAVLIFAAWAGGSSVLKFVHLSVLTPYRYLIPFGILLAGTTATL